MTKLGHNSNLNSDEKFRLDGYVKELEREEHNRTIIGGNITAIYKDAKGRGFNTKALRELIRLRKMAKSGRDNYQNALDAYSRVLDEFSRTPLGQAMAPHGRQHPGEDGNPYD